MCWGKQMRQFIRFFTVSVFIIASRITCSYFYFYLTNLGIKASLLQRHHVTMTNPIILTGLTYNKVYIKCVSSFLICKTGRILIIKDIPSRSYLRQAATFPRTTTIVTVFISTINCTNVTRLNTG